MIKFRTILSMSLSLLSRYLFRLVTAAGGYVLPSPGSETLYVASCAPQLARQDKTRRRPPLAPKYGVCWDVEVLNTKCGLP